MATLETSADDTKPENAGVVISGLQHMVQENAEEHEKKPIEASVEPMWTVPRENSGKANTDASKKRNHNHTRRRSMHNMGEGKATSGLDENKSSLLDPNGDGEPALFHGSPHVVLEY